MILGGLEPEILAILASGVGHFGKWPPSLLWDKAAMALQGIYFHHLFQRFFDIEQYFVSFCEAFEYHL